MWHLEDRHLLQIEKHLCSKNWQVSQIPQCTCPISHNAPFRTEMFTFLFWMAYCWIWEKVHCVICENVIWARSRNCGSPMTRPIYLWSFINPFVSEAGIFLENLINTVAADTMAPCSPRSSAVMLLTMSSMRQNFVYLCHLSVNKWYKENMYFYTSLNFITR